MNVQSGGGGDRRAVTRDAGLVRPVPVAEERARRQAAEDEAAADEALRRAVDRARRLSEDQPEPFRALAFTALLAHLLHGGGATATAASRSASGPAPSASPPNTAIPIAEFLAQRRLDSHPDRVVAIAYYYFQRDDGRGVTTKDLVDGYTRSRARRPQNYPDVVASCVRKGYLIDGGRRDGMKTWVITGSGEAHVEQDL